MVKRWVFSPRLHQTLLVNTARGAPVKARKEKDKGKLSL
jgi:hypothetical protein